MKTICGDRNFFRFRGAVSQNGFVNVIAVLLLLEHRNIFLRDDVERDVFDCDLVELRIDCNQIDRARFVYLDITKIAASFAADHVRQCRHERADVAGNAATALAFKPFRDEAHRIGCIGESFELQVKLGVSLVVGFLFA